MKAKGTKNHFSAECRNEMKLRLPSLSVNEGMARAAVSAFCAQLDPAPSELADIKCAVSEAVTTCIVHAYKDTIGLIYITVRLCEGNLVRIEIKDKGCGIEDVKLAMTPLYTTDTTGERSGMGFAVMQTFTDRLEVHSKKNEGVRILMEKKLK